jgi:tRNA-uridine 2-sulfurtransferase
VATDATAAGLDPVPLPPSTARSAQSFALVAMSGGVDSSVAAALLLEQGYEVAGLTLRLTDDPEGDGDPRTRTCCAPDDISDARRVARVLQIPHYVSNYKDVFEAEVIDPFVRSYAAGRTPNPCVLCNERVKFAPLLSRARGLGAAILATGHYARVAAAADGTHRLLRGRDRQKDQSYFLYGLGQDALATVRFPLGDLEKGEVRERARALGLATADKPDSQEICFVGDRRYDAVVDARLPVIPEGGEIVHVDGRVLGRHDGIHRFTIGQRRGLGVSSAEPLYVVDLEPESGRVRVGDRVDLEREVLVLGATRWVSGRPPACDRPITVRIRHRHAGVPGRVVQAEGEGCEIRVDAPVAAPAPGQAIVLYDGDEVLGGGTMETGR